VEADFIAEQLLKRRDGDISSKSPLFQSWQLSITHPWVCA